MFDKNSFATLSKLLDGVFVAVCVGYVRLTLANPYLNFVLNEIITLDIAK